MPNWNKLNLSKDDDKIKLIEILLIVGSILVAFKFLPDNMVWIFLLFVVLAIALFIKLKEGSEKNKYYNLNVAFASMCFSGTLSFELAYSLGLVVKMGNPPYIDPVLVAQIIAILYYVLIAFILYSALKWKKE
jgi:hypothetical protein